MEDKQIEKKGDDVQITVIKHAYYHSIHGMRSFIGENQFTYFFFLQIYFLCFILFMIIFFVNKSFMVDMYIILKYRCHVNI